MTDGCLARKYLPQPPRVWLRSTGICEIIYQNDENGTVYLPYFNKNVSVNEAIYLKKMLYKGNILQYSSQATQLGGYTKKMNYARIAKGFGKFRKRGWASQTDSYTSPNVNSFHRENFTITSNNSNGEIRLPECRESFVENIVFPIPSDPIPDLENPIFPPINDPADIISYDYPVTPIDPVINDSVVEGGNLRHCTRGGICTGEIKEFIRNTACFPTSASDVPGPIINLCYPNNAPAFYPRVRRKYTTASTKWHINAKIAIPAYNKN